MFTKIVQINQFAINDYTLNDQLRASELVCVTHPITGEEYTAIVLIIFVDLNKLRGDAVDDLPAAGSHNLLEVDNKNKELVDKLADKFEENLRVIFLEKSEVSLRMTIGMDYTCGVFISHITCLPNTSRECKMRTNWHLLEPWIHAKDSTTTSQHQSLQAFAERVSRLSMELLVPIPANYAALKVAEIKPILRECSLTISGRNPKLVLQLENHDA